MPASRWQTSMAEMFEWMGQADDELKMLVPSVFSRFGKKEDALEANDSQKNESPKYPEVLPILPLRGLVVYPQTAVPLTVGQPRSIRLVDDVVGTDKLVGLVAAINPDWSRPVQRTCIKSAWSQPCTASARPRWNRPLAGAGHGPFPTR